MSVMLGDPITRRAVRKCSLVDCEPIWVIDRVSIQTIYRLRHRDSIHSRG